MKFHFKKFHAYPEATVQYKVKYNSRNCTEQYNKEKDALKNDTIFEKLFSVNIPF
jgi:hypothetical protein